MVPYCTRLFTDLFYITSYVIFTHFILNFSPEYYVSSPAYTERRAIVVQAVSAAPPRPLAPDGYWLKVPEKRQHIFLRHNRTKKWLLGFFSLTDIATSVRIKTLWIILYKFVQESE